MIATYNVFCLRSPPTSNDGDIERVIEMLGLNSTHTQLIA
jgi:hypothetical protein